MSGSSRRNIPANLGAALLLVCAAAVQPAQAESEGRSAPDRSWKKGLAKPADHPQGGVAGLPHANGRRFPTLDAYLAYLRTYAAPMDRPWYREVGPDRFRLETGNLRSGAPPRTFTRDELERKFGFRK